jgi:hypothetical protein
MSSCGFGKNLRERKNKVLAFGVIRNIGEIEKTFAFACPAPA